MSNALLYRWLALPYWLHVLTLLLVAGSLALTVWQFGQRPLQQQALLLTQQQQQQENLYRAILRGLRHLEPLQTIAAEIARLQQALQPSGKQAFSLPQLTKEVGESLQLWQPTARGGELTLVVSWLQVQDVLQYLSERQPAIELVQFSLKRINGQLMLRLVLHYDA